MATEQFEERERVEIPPYYDRFQEEREKRFLSELARLEAAITRNGQRIDELRTDIAERDALLRTDTGEHNTRLMDQGRILREEISGVRSELVALRAEMTSLFRWTIALLLPIVTGVLAIIFKVFFATP